MELKTYRVVVCELDPGDKRKYILEGQCIHFIKALSGTEARAEAIKEHKEACVNPS
jgi:hypothetical protein